MPDEDCTTPAVEYRLIPGETDYRVGADGSVWTRIGRGRSKSDRREWISMHGTKTAHGYQAVVLHRKPVHIHRLVLEAFVGPRPPGKMCRHLDGNPANNRLENLKWGTARENHEDAVRHGTFRISLANLRPTVPGGTGGKRFGQDNPAAKFDEATVRKIAAVRVETGYGSAKIGNALGLPKSMRRSVDRVICGETWSHVTGFSPNPPKP